MSTLSNILALLTQLSLIVTCTFLLGLLRPRLRSLNARASIVLEGGLYGLFAILVMLNPIREADGVIFDLRNVIIAVAGAFGGPVPAAIISVFVIAYRITLGGAGIATAVGSALTCVVLSVVVYSYRKRYTPKPAVWLVGLGLVAGLETIAWLLVLPAETARQVIAAIGLPILITYPISSWLFGSLLLSQAHHEELEAALTAERNMLRTLIDTIPGNVYIKDTQSRFVDANIVTLHRFGIESLDDLVGKTDDEFFTPELAGKYLADEQTVLQSGEPLLNCEELTFDQRTQQHIWFLTTKAPIRSERGEITGLVGVGLDITERKQAEQVLRANAEAEHHFQAALQALHEITIELTQIDSLDNFYRRVVELALQRLGFDRFGLLLYDAAHASVVGTYGTDAQGKVVAEHHLRIDPALLTGILKRTLDAKERLVFDENAALFSNLEPIGFGWNAVTSLWNGAQTLGWVAADNGVQHQPLSQPLLDILALYAQTVATLLGRKQAEAALRANEAKLQTFFEMLPVGISVFNADGQIVEMNPALGRILDISAERLQRNDFRIRQYIFDDGRPVADSELPNVRARVEQQAIHNVVIGVIKEDGKTVWTSISAAPLPGADAGVITVTADITERKQAEAQAFALDAERQRVKLLREFIADVSHDLRTPLSVIGTSAYLIDTTTEPSKRTYYVQRIETQLDRLKLLLDNFVELANLQQQESSLQFQPTDLDAVLNTIVELSREDVAAKHQLLEYRRDMDAAWSMGNAAALSKAIACVVTNAIHYTPEAGKITLRLYRDGDQAVVEVADTGIGISSADLPHVFDSFFRVGQARSTESGGAGLGLSIAKRIIELMQGHIEARSELGKGSVFKIYLPLQP